MKRLIFFILTLALVGATSLLAQMRGGHAGGRGGMQPSVSGPQHQPDPQHPQGPQAGAPQPRRTQECEHFCLKAREEARNLERYTERRSFEPQTARQLGRQLRQRLEAMEQEHLRLRQRLSAAEQEQHRDHWQTMNRCQEHWRESLAALEQELGKEAPRRDALRRHARTIDKELKNYHKEMQQLEETQGD